MNEDIVKVPGTIVRNAETKVLADLTKMERNVVAKDGRGPGNIRLQPKSTRIS